MLGRRGKGGAPRRSRFALDDRKLLRMRPTLDRCIERGRPGSRELAGFHAMRALAALAAGDQEGALVDADAALGIEAIHPEGERLAVTALARAVLGLERSDRYGEVLGRLEALDLDGADHTSAQTLRLGRAQLLVQLGRGEEARAVLHAAPIHLYPDRPDYGEALVSRAGIHLDAGRVEEALADVDAAMEAGIGEASTSQAANLGAYCIAVLGRADRADQGLAWANLACTTDRSGPEPQLALRETRAAVLAVAGRGPEAIATLEEGLAFLEQDQRDHPELAWSHAFLARAHLDAGDLDEARRHALLADELAARHLVAVPVLDAVRDRLR